MDSIAKENRQRNTIFLKLTNDFKSTNDKILLENITLQRAKNQQKQNESYDFFPFTHGEQIETLRANQKQQARVDLKERLKEKGAKTRQKMSQSFYNHRSPLCSYEGSRENLDQGVTSIDEIKRNKGCIPKFMQPAKIYPYRRLNNNHVKKVMRDAIKKVEEESIELDRQLMDNKKYFDAIEIKRETQRLALKSSLINQMEIEKFNRMKTKVLSNERTNTNFGPEETPEQLEKQRSHK